MTEGGIELDPIDESALTLWDRRMVSAISTANAARKGVVVLRVIAAVVALAALVGNALVVDDLRLVMTGWSGDVGFLPSWVVICVVMLSVLVTAIVRRRVVTVPLSAIGLALVVSEMFFIGFTKGVVLGPGLPILALSATFALGAAVEPAMRLRAMAQAVTRAVVSST